MSELALARILLVDLRSQLTMNIWRLARELGYRVAILPPKKAAEWLSAGTPTDAIILSGGNFSVFEEGAPQIPGEVFEARRADGSNVPIFGICYGHQGLAYDLGGKVATIHPEYGRTTIRLCQSPSVLFDGLPKEQSVWMNHGDTVTEVPPGFLVTARSRDTNAIAAMENVAENRFSTQFHAEATETVFGPQMLGNFLKFSGAPKDWSASSLVDATRGMLDNELGDDNLVLPFSGGVDSTTVAAIAEPVLRERLHAVTIDARQLRLNEVDEIRLHARAAGLVNHRVVNMHDKVALFAGITDAETKRKVVFQQGIYLPGILGEIQRVSATRVMDGTLGPDLIESGKTGGEIIKTHHNIGLDYGVPQLHPLGNLFKYEVREIARKLGLPESVSERKPSPGPGGFLGIIGVPVCNEYLDCLAESTYHVERILQTNRKFWCEEVSQPVVGYFGTPTTGQKGDGRVYRGFIAVRAVKTLDYMTAEGLEIPSAMRREIKSVVTKHRLVVRCMFDETDKPPATTVFE